VNGQVLARPDQPDLMACRQPGQAMAGRYVLLTSAALEERPAAEHVDGTPGVVLDDDTPWH
jgi:hypothetical protein